MEANTSTLNRIPESQRTFIDNERTKATENLKKLQEEQKALNLEFQARFKSTKK